LQVGAGATAGSGQWAELRGISFWQARRYGVGGLAQLYGNGGQEMPDAIGEVLGQPAEQATATVTPGQVLQVAKDNFVIVSATTVAFGVALATIFLASYLSIFDWHLLWFVQYTDIITFGLVALGILGGSLTLLQALAQTVLSAAENSGKVKRSRLRIAGLIFVLLSALILFGKIRRGEEYFHILFGATAIFIGVWLLLSVIEIITRRAWPTVGQVMFVMFFAVLNTICFGQWLGFSVKETSEFNQDIYLKDQTLNNAKLVIVMSRHTVLLKDGVLYVVPTADVAKFRTAGK
jgi:hypothetical protein